MAWKDDSFDRADESLDASGGWVERNGNFSIISNQANLVTNPASDAVVAYNSTGVVSADYYVQAPCRYPTGAGDSWLGVGGRRVNFSTSDSDSYIALLNLGSGVLRLYKRVSGSYTQLGEYAFTISRDTDYTVRLTMNGSTISVTLDGTSRISVTDTSLTAQGDYCLHNGSGGSGTGYVWQSFIADGLSTTEQIPSATLRLTSFAPTTYQSIPEPITAATLRLTGFAPNATVVQTAITKSIPSANLVLTGIAPFIYKKTEIPSAYLTLTPFAPNATVTSSSTITKSVPSATLSITSAAPSTYGTVVKQIPSSNLTLTSFAPLAEIVIPGRVLKQIPSSELRLVSFNPSIPGDEVAERKAGGGVRHRPHKLVIIGNKKHVINDYSQLRFLLEKYVKEQQQKLNEIPVTKKNKKRIKLISSKVEQAQEQLAKVTQWTIEEENEALILMLVA